MDIATSMLITQIPYYVVIFILIREIRRLRKNSKVIEDIVF